MNDLLKNYPVIIQFPVAWGDMDAFGHVNNVMYFKYFESARIAYFEKANIMEVMNKTNIGPILKETGCKFKIPLTYPDTISAAARVPKLEEDRFVMEYCVYSHTHQKIAAEGTGLIVAYDYKEKKKTKIPEELISYLKKLENIP